MVSELTGLRGMKEFINVSDPETHYSGYVPEGERWFIERVGVFNDVTDDTECRIILETGGMSYPIVEFLNITVDIWEMKDIKLWLFPNERLAFKWSGITADDPLKMTWHGHRRNF